MIYVFCFDFDLQEEDAARAYDRAAIIMHRPENQLNFGYAAYSNEIEELRKLGIDNFVAIFREFGGRIAVKETP